MPIEIKELLIQAKLAEESGKTPHMRDLGEFTPAQTQPPKASSPVVDKEQIIEECMRRVMDWLQEQRLR